ncbi:dienelactone hydrolase family protein [Kribbella sp. NPDC049227]|uniref:dienelactone hydrolase family protein n=1 Tax=Kribbella sp. NPDC049227 TaxID=3364113 RepID=UPI003712C1D8
MVQIIRYPQDGVELVGELYGVASSPQPGLLLIHGGAGLDEHAREQAQRFASEGYAVLAADMYGEDVRGDRSKLMGLLATFRDDHHSLASRAQAGLTVLTEHPAVSEVVAAIGYCFGGMAALSLARAGVALAGTVSIHGSLATPTPAAAGSIAAKVLVCHGSADPHIPLSDVTAFAEEMDGAQAEWQLNLYGNAQHGFTHRHATPGDTPGVAYQPAADEQSFDDVLRFLTTLKN